MVKTPAQAGARARPRTRARERGAALFVVVLVITLLMGIGAFAARTAHVVTAASGSERQMIQARYVAEYGLQYAAAKFANASGNQMRLTMDPPLSLRTSKGLPADVCYGQDLIPAATPSRTCLMMSANQMQTYDLNAATGGYQVCDRVVGATPGSLGMLGVGPAPLSPSGAECDFNVELSDVTQGLSPPGSPLPCMPGNCFYFVTATSTGQVRLRNLTPPGLDVNAGESSSTQVIRGRLRVGPF